MRIFGGLSFGGRKLRAGISRKGTPWVGGRASAGPLYAGVLASAGGRSSSGTRSRVNLAGTVAAVRLRSRSRKKVTVEMRLVDGRECALTFYREGAEVLAELLTEDDQ